ncbi:MAG TPA: AMP-binding protein [Gemmatimonadaceae bacterium]|jgi:acyl-CoA synthetase (AMP-forming)/AMP-acid ligase II|nr:AMP-binding protein [Gemmatimonadaceae bacterium]
MGCIIQPSRTGARPLRPIDHLHRGLERNPNAVAVAGPGRPLTYAELVASVHALAAAMQALDSAPGSRVGICARNTVEHLIALLATYAAGKVWVPLNPTNGRAELDRMIAATKPTLLVADESCLGRFTPTGAPLVLGKTSAAVSEPSVRSLIVEWKGRRPDDIARAVEDAQIIKFSGGSTGTPKPVVQPVRCLNAQVEGILACFGLDASDVNLIAAPLTHGASCFVLPMLAVGGRHVLLEEPKPANVLAAIDQYGVTTMYAPPTLIYGMVGESRASGADRSAGRFTSLRHLIYSAAPMRPDQIRSAQRVFGPVVETAYGQVEAPQIVTALRAAELERDENLTSVGRPSPVATVRIMSSVGELVPSGEMGEIVVRGPLVMSGYLDRPEMTAETIIDGWLHTGDLGLIDDRGYVHIRGRLREMINSGGFKIFPGDVEAVLASHPAVAECSVFGVEDDKWGEAVHAAVCLAPGTLVDGTELIAFVKEELGSVKAPKTIHIVGALPRNAAGKVSRKEVGRMVMTSFRATGEESPSSR